jgi:hypothetical protein
VRERVNGVAVDCRRAGDEVPEIVTDCEVEDGGRDCSEMTVFTESGPM